jgi:hypothetical protein
MENAVEPALGLRDSRIDDRHPAFTQSEVGGRTDDTLVPLCLDGCETGFITSLNRRRREIFHGSSAESRALPETEGEKVHDM